MGTSPQLLTGREIPNSDPEHGTSQRAQFPMQAIRSTILVVLFSLSAQANDWSVTATDSIQAAIQAASSGDRILIDPGTYHEVLDLQGKRLELIGLGGATTTTVNGTGLGNCVVLADGVASGTRLHGLTLTAVVPGGPSLRALASTTTAVPSGREAAPNSKSPIAS